MMSSIKVTPTEAQINQCQHNIDEFIESIRNNSDQRAGAWPYNKFHKWNKIKIYLLYPLYRRAMLYP